MTTQQNFMEWVQENDFRRNLFTVIMVFIALLLIVKTVFVFKQAVEYKNPSNMNYITATGKAEKYVKPDTLTFSVNINEEGKTTEEATKKVADKVTKAMSILKSNGVKEENIKLEYYNIQDKYETVSNICVNTSAATIEKTMAPMAVSMPASMPCQTSNSNIVGQIVTQSITVKIPDIENNADNDIRTKIISQLSAENIKADGFSFTVYDIDAVKKEIRAEAIENAKADAKKLAKDLGVHLDDLTSFSENNGGYIPYMSARADAVKTVAGSAATPSAPELAPGQQRVTDEVSLTYSIR